MTITDILLGIVIVSGLLFAIVVCAIPSPNPYLDAEEDEDNE